jgi:hypothetical protein
VILYIVRGSVCLGFRLHSGALSYLNMLSYASVNGRTGLCSARWLIDLFWGTAQLVIDVDFGVPVVMSSSYAFVVSEVYANWHSSI